VDNVVSSYTATDFDFGKRHLILSLVRAQPYIAMIPWKLVH